LLEEVLFRGILYGGLRRLGRWPLAMAASSLLYALCHMLGKATVPATVVWSSGLAAVVEMLRGPLLVQWWSPALFNLCLVGCILAWTYRASGNLLLPISLHASWIFSLKTFGLFTRAGQAANPGVEASGRLLESWFLFGALLLLPALIRGAVARRAPAPTSPCPPPSRAC
jgi:membrane protease YdiL (CAAX protease family)